MGTSHTRPAKMTTTTTITVFILAFTLSHSHPFFLRINEEDGLSSRSSNQTEDDSGLTQDTILGVFDTVTGLTYGLGGLFQQFEDGFEKIRPQSDTSVTNKVFLNDEEEEEAANLGSSAVVGLFDSLRNLNRHVGKLVGRVGDTLTDRRDNVVRLASNLDTGLKNVGSGFHDWREENFGVTLRRKKVTEAEAEAEADKDAEDGDNEVEDIEV